MRDEAVARPGGEEHAEAGGDRSRHERFGEQLSHESRAACTDRQPHRDLALARDAASEQQVGCAGARDGEEQPDQREEDPQRFGELPPDAREAGGPGRESVCLPPDTWPAGRPAAPGFVVTSSTAGQMRLSATFACSRLRPSRSRPIRCSHELDVEASAPRVLNGRERDGDVRREPCRDAEEAARRDADNRERPAVDADDPADDRAVAVRSGAASSA